MKPKLTIEKLHNEAALFSRNESSHWEPKLYGVTDGKAVGTYFEHKFQLCLREKYSYSEGNSAKGIDFPGLLVDMKVTSIKQPQSSCPFKSARQKVFGLGYSLLVFVYEKRDNESKKLRNLNIIHNIFIKKDKTADYQATIGLKQILENEGNREDILAFLSDRNLPVDNIEANSNCE